MKLPLVLAEHNQDYGKGFGVASEVVVGGMTDRIDRTQKAFDLNSTSVQKEGKFEVINIAFYSYQVFIKNFVLKKQQNIYHYQCGSTYVIPNAFGKLNYKGIDRI